MRENERTIMANIPPERTLVEALRERLAADTGEPVALEETHISWVLLTAQHAYKLKKPVRLPFADFAEPAARRHFCEEEVRLNRRLAPALYLGVVPVYGMARAPRLGREGEESEEGGPIDYLVHMRRFAPGALLSEMLASGQVQAGRLEALGQLLADFHRGAPVAPASSGFGTPGRIAVAVREVLAQLAAASADPRLPALGQAVEEQLTPLAPVWQQRSEAGAVRECHGDLHLANVVALGDAFTPFDCIEFDPALRWIDTMSDLAFLTMDLQAHGRSDLAFGVLDAYLQRSGDHDGLRTLRFYEVYRALVRALVACLRARAVGGASAAAPDYIGFAARAVVAGGRLRPLARLLVTHGLSGSGKSTAADRLLRLSGAVRLRSDVERKRLFGLEALQRSRGIADDIYTFEATRRTFDRLQALAGIALQAGYPVIVDAAFLRRAERDAFRALATALGVPFTILHCHASGAALRQRVTARTLRGDDPSEADIDVLARQEAFAEALAADEQPSTIHLDTGQPADAAALCVRWLTQR
jgi:aminoglycoside phosphotransferase family enzyme/predicted kinase